MTTSSSPLHTASSISISPGGMNGHLANGGGGPRSAGLAQQQQQAAAAFSPNLNNAGKENPNFLSFGQAWASSNQPSSVEGGLGLNTNSQAYGGGAGAGNEAWMGLDFSTTPGGVGGPNGSGGGNFWHS